MKICKVCGKAIIPKNKANNIKYCSQKCRNKYYYDKFDRVKYQRDRYQNNLLQDKKNKIQCKICGKYFRKVGSHIVQTHGVTAREYRESYGFDVKKGQLPDDLKEKCSILAIERGGYKNLILGKKYWFKPGQVGVGKYKRSQQTLERLRNLHKFNKKYSL